ncbi:hypothetical protein ACHAXH_007845, partial [Discostella pseudostelligera]
ADFLAADTASKQQQQQQQQKQQGVKKQQVVNQFDESLFDQQGGEYQLEEDVVYGGDTAAFNALMGASRAKGPPTAETATATATNIAAPSSSSSATIIADTTNAPPPPQAPPAPPLLLPPVQPAMMFPPPPPHMTGFVMPPPPGVPVLPPQPPMMLNPMLVPVPPVMPIMGMIPPPHLQNRGTMAGSRAGGAGAGPAAPFDSDDFPALGSTATATTDGRKNQEESKMTTTTAAIVTPTMENNIILGTTTIIPSEAQIIFNNTNPHTPPISAHLIQSKLMPFRDTCFIVNIMMRTLKSSDAYNDDYYHWSVLNRATTNGASNPQHLAMPGTMMPPTVQPTPLLKGMKETVKEQQHAFQQRVKARAKTFAEEQKSLGQLVKTNVKRPKALLDTPVLKKEDESEDTSATGTTTAMALDNKYEAGQQVSRIHLWKARVTIDRGYTAFLSLMELRRLIQTQMRGDPRILQELMVDVKSNIDLLHSSLGVSVQVNAEGSKTIEIDKVRLSTTLSLPKGRILCARSIEEGIVPHPSACNLLPVALNAIFSESLPVDGEERLLHAFTGLILTESPGVDPRILCMCLEVATSFASSENTPTIDCIASNSSSLTSSRMRMNLLHAVLSMGKHVCAGSSLNNDWMEREQLFRGMLNLS